MARCSGMTYEGSFPTPCRFEAVEDGLCKRHLAGKRRRLASDAQAEQRRKAYNEAFSAIAARLKAAGVKGQPYTLPHTPVYTLPSSEWVLVRLADVERLAARSEKGGA